MTRFALSSWALTHLLPALIALHSASPTHVIGCCPRSKQGTSPAFAGTHSVSPNAMRSEHELVVAGPVETLPLRQQARPAPHETPRHRMTAVLEHAGSVVFELAHFAV